MKYVKELLKALLAHNPGQDVEWEEPWCALFHGHWEDEDINDMCSVNRIYINENNELSFDLTKESWNNDGDYLDAEELKDVTWDFILDETYEIDWNEDELMEFIQSLCDDLHELVIPSDVTEINEGVFKGCTSLQKIVISDGVKSIGKNAFQGCKSLETVHLPAGADVTEIKEGAFKGCTSLQNIVISDGVKSIGKNAFQGCKSLETVHLPAGVSNIASNSFADCKNLKAIYVPENNVDFYKERFPSDMHWLIIEEGSDFQVKSEHVIAKDISFAPTLRVIVSNSETDSGILSAATMHLEKWSKSQIIKWVIDNLATIVDSKEPYNEKNDDL